MDIKNHPGFIAFTAKKSDAETEVEVSAERDKIDNQAEKAVTDTRAQ